MRLIDADILKSKIKTMEVKANIHGPLAKYLDPLLEDWLRDIATQAMLAYVDDCSTADAALIRHGRWVNQDDTYTRFSCSVCGLQNFPHSGAPYCLRCGAKMDASYP